MAFVLGKNTADTTVEIAKFAKTNSLESLLERLQAAASNPTIEQSSVTIFLLLLDLEHITQVVVNHS